MKAQLIESTFANNYAEVDVTVSGLTFHFTHENRHKEMRLQSVSQEGTEMPKLILDVIDDNSVRMHQIRECAWDCFNAHRDEWLQLEEERQRQESEDEEWLAAERQHQQDLLESNMWL